MRIKDQVEASPLALTRLPKAITCSHHRAIALSEENFLLPYRSQKTVRARKRCNQLLAVSLCAFQMVLRPVVGFYFFFSFFPERVDIIVKCLSDRAWDWFQRGGLLAQNRRAQSQLHVADHKGKRCLWLLAQDSVKKRRNRRLSQETPHLEGRRERFCVATV